MAKAKNNTLKLKFDTSWNYAPAPESKSIAAIKDKYDLFINGAFVKPSSKKYFKTINPANEEVLSEVADANAADVDKAVKAARTAYDKVWKKMSGKERGKYIYRIARMVQERAREFAVIETLDGGKPIRVSKGEGVAVGRCGARLMPAQAAKRLRRWIVRRGRPRPGRSFPGIFLC